MAVPVRPCSMVRTARRSPCMVGKLPLALALSTGLWAGLVSRQASADPLDSSETSDAGPRAASLPRLTLDEYPPPSARRNLIIAGVVSTAAWYGLALGSSYIWPDAVGAKDLRIPVAGPWIALSHTGCGNVSDCSKLLVVFRAIATTVDAIGQASGLALAAEGLFLPTQEAKRMTSQAARFQVQPSFDAGRNTVGFGVLGVF